jgi:hypothetical protein
MSRLIATCIVGSAFAATANVHAANLNSSAAARAAAVAAPQFQSRDVLQPTGGDRAVRQILTRIRTDADALRRSMPLSAPRSGSARQPENDAALYLIDDVVQASNHLTDHLDRGQVLQPDVEDVLRRGAALQDAIPGRGFSQQVQSGWNRLRSDLDSLASAYRLNWNWQSPRLSSNPPGGLYDRLTGTYRLDTARSDDPRRAADQALRQIPAAERARTSQRMQGRLDAPDVIAIDRQGSRVTLVSSRAPRTSFDADGRPQTERGFGNRDVTTRATLYGDRLEVVTNGDTDNDFSATFEPLDNGQSLEVTKSLTIGGARQPIVVRSFYRRTSETAEWDVYDRRAVGTSGRSSNYGVLVPEGTTIVATLDDPVNGRSVRQNDRVSLTVHNAPSAALDNAVIEGYIASVPAASDGGGMSIAFNQIRLPNGRTSSFAGTIENVRGPNGEPISFNGEAVGADANQRDQAIQRGAIGAAVGALIGAVAGGGKGAAIGAVVGAGGGAATILLGDQRSSDLPRGTEFTIRAREVLQ